MPAISVPEKILGLGRFPAYHGHCSTLAGSVTAQGCPPEATDKSAQGETMEEHLAQELVNIMKKNTTCQFEEAFERAFELTKAYAGSANAQASAIPSVFEKVFELFVTGNNKS